MDESKSKKRFLGSALHWFAYRDKTWSTISISSLFMLATLWASFVIFGDHFGSAFANWMPIISAPVVLAFVLGMFWRGSLQTLLSLCGAISTYFGFYAYSKFLVLPVSQSAIVTNKLGVGQTALAASIDSTATYYFLMGIFAFVFVLLLTYRPRLFRAKGNNFALPYPVWTDRDRAMDEMLSATTMLVPVSGLMDYAERHLSTKYRYLVILIGGKRYFVSPDDWVPQGSFIVRDARSRSLLGIPKVADGFNIW